MALCVSIVPFARGLSNSHAFYVRDLSLFFWGRYLWLRRAWMSGEWPLWDPYVGAGQAAHSDALHQMFLPPAIFARLIGGEVLGFNLWVLLPFPLAALGAWLCFARRTSAAAATIGAIAFATCGPVVSGGNFPNLSWSVAMLPWVLWAVDRLVLRPTGRNATIVAATVALQSVAGEPVTLFTTLCVAIAYAAVFGAGAESPRVSRATRSAAVSGMAAALGLTIAAIQMVPMAAASRLADRADSIVTDTWSLRPTALAETVWPHLFGNYFETQSLAEVPWMPLMYTGREPLLFSIYFGVPLLTLALFGLAGNGDRRWRLFWVTTGLVGVVASFGAYTPIYPILRDHVPPFGLFRFPVKYFVVVAMAVAAGAASGWDALAARRTSMRTERFDAANARRERRSRVLSVALPILVGTGVLCSAAACVYATGPTVRALSAFARALGDEKGTVAAEWMLRAMREGAVQIALVSIVTATLFALLMNARPRPVVFGAQSALGVLIVGDLLLRAWAINPVLPASHFAEPAWLSYVKAQPDARFYVGGKQGGSLSTMDIDGSRGYLDAPGLSGSASRATLSLQAAFYPSAWQAREMLSYDLPVLWPRPFADMAKWFGERGGEERERLLDRTGVRYRVLPQRRAGDRVPLTPIPQFYESFLYDFGDAAAPRAAIVATARIVPEVKAQIEALFAEGWDSRAVVLVDRETPPAGIQGDPTAPFARIVHESFNGAALEVGVGAGDGYLVFLDSYADDWRATVDGQAAIVARANGLVRAVHLTRGRHRVEFSYRPASLAAGASVSLAGLVCALALVVWGGQAPRAAL